jgi:hypothetical protein
LALAVGVFAVATFLDVTAFSLAAAFKALAGLARTFGSFV